MISRVAEHCFWMSRYLERAENTARVLDVNQTLLLDFDVPVEQQWRPLLIISGIHDLPGEADAEAVQNYLTWETKTPAASSPRWPRPARTPASSAKSSAPRCGSGSTTTTSGCKGRRRSELYDRNRSEFYNQIKRINQLIHGIGEGTMSHGEAWEFFQLGKYLERACQTARILDVKYHILLPTPEHVGTPVDNAHWVAILTSCSGYEPFHKKRPAIADPAVVGGGFPDLRSALPALGAALPARVPGGRPRHLRPAGGRARATRSSKVWTTWSAGWIATTDRRPRPGRSARGADQRRQPHPRHRRGHPPDLLRPAPQTSQSFGRSGPAPVSAPRNKQSDETCQCRVDTPVR